jgi:6-phosphogluconolactonase
MRLLAIDHGEKRTGLAICDASERVVSPLKVLENPETCIRQIQTVVETYRVEAILIGLPYNMDGTEGPRAAKVRQFADQVRQTLSVPILFFDERLSSFQAQEKLAAMGLTRKGRKKRLDAVAAAAILEGFLEARKQGLASFPGRLIRTDDAESLAEKVLMEFLSEAEKALEDRGCFRTAVCGGQTPRRFFERLAVSEKARKMDWKRVHWFWTDERAVEPDDARSNYRLAAETFLKTLPIPAQQVYRMEGEAEDLAAAAIRYENTMHRVFGTQPGQVPALDLVLLGIGTDGHMASLFPGSEALAETRSLVRAVVGPDGLNRLTLTVPVLQAARSILLLISGAEKAPILCTLLTHSPEDSVYPAHLLWPVLHKTTWVVDAEAASLLGEFPGEAGFSGL